MKDAEKRGCEVHETSGHFAPGDCSCFSQLLDQVISYSFVPLLWLDPPQPLQRWKQDHGNLTNRARISRAPLERWGVWLLLCLGDYLLFWSAREPPLYVNGEIMGIYRGSTQVLYYPR